jgi:hypothetical protein
MVVGIWSLPHVFSHGMHFKFVPPLVKIFGRGKVGKQGCCCFKCETSPVPTPMHDQLSPHHAHAAAGIAVLYRPAALLARSGFSLSMSNGGSPNLICPRWLPDDGTWEGREAICSCVYLEAFLTVMLFLIALYVAHAAERRTRWVGGCVH